MQAGEREREREEVEKRRRRRRCRRHRRMQTSFFLLTKEKTHVDPVLLRAEQRREVLGHGRRER